MSHSETFFSSGIRDNRERGSVANFLREKIRSGSNLSVVSAYFTIYAYDALKDELDGIEHLQFLFGEPSFVRSIDPDKADKKSFAIEDDGLQLQNKLQQHKVAKECAEWIDKKVDIRSVKQANLLHGKMYHIDNQGVEEAILGSSNFTLSGIGMAGDGRNNVELNLVVDGNRDRTDLKNWFNAIWEDETLVEDVKTEVLNHLEQLYQDNSPEFIYFKTLFHIFEKFIDEQATGGLEQIQKQIVDSQIWNALFEFQQDGVKGAINKLLAYDGCIIADSVGLGKTFEALAIIKYFELRSERVLVLCPKKLRENWTVYQAHNSSELNPFLKDRFSYTVLSHTDLSRESGKSGDIDLANFTWSNFDLIVIDESHNFRNNTPGRKDEDGNLIRKSRYQRLMEDILQKGVKTKVLLLSATPVNNTLKDLRNQIYLITEKEDTVFKDSLNIPSIQETLRVAQLNFSEWASKSKDHKTSELMEKLSSAFFRLLDGLTIARSRKHVEKYYKESVKLLGGFPKRKPPISVSPEIDLEGQFMSYDRLNKEIDNYQLSLFNPSKYVLDEFKPLYEKEKVVAFSQSLRENFLIGMMKVNFLKRLESSINSFDLTLLRTVQKMDDLAVRIKLFKEFQSENPDLDFNELTIEDIDDDELQQALEVGKVGFKMAHLRIDDWLKDLKEDRDQLHLLQLAAHEITPERDAKLKELKDIIEEKASNPTINNKGLPNRKVLIFTAFSDTALYLYEALEKWAQDKLGIHIAMVSGGTKGTKTSFGKSDFNQILINFSPYSKNRNKMESMPQDEQIDLLIATDCISEGQNLQDCDFLVNYDIHWNPVRVIQRFGRIDRIGSINPAVHLVNFWPTDDLDQYITLKSRVESRMALVDLAATTDDNLLNTEAIEDMITDDLKYRDRQLKRLQKEILDLEDFNETVSLTDFTLDDFRAELSRFIEANRNLLEDAPLGLYAVVPTDLTVPVIRPGVIFCLKQKAGQEKSDTVNPTQPYFLIYIQNEGIVRFNFTHPKQILDIFRELCSGKASAYENLCGAFDLQTENGGKMDFYSDLLAKAMKAIESNFRKRIVGNLLTNRQAVLPIRQQQVNEETDFELITWLVIR